MKSKFWKIFNLKSKFEKKKGEKPIFRSSHFHEEYNSGNERDLEKSTLKRWKLDNLLDEVRARVLLETELWITVEAYASVFKAKKHLVDQCFAVLNREGLLSQAYNHAPDRRNKKSFFHHPTETDSEWTASRYKVLANDDLSPPPLDS